MKTLSLSQCVVLLKYNASSSLERMHFDLFNDNLANIISYNRILLCLHIILFYFQELANPYILAGKIISCHLRKTYVDFCVKST